MSGGVYILGGSQTDFARNWAREGLAVLWGLIYGPSLLVVQAYFIYSGSLHFTLAAFQYFSSLDFVQVQI